MSILGIILLIIVLGVVFGGFYGGPSPGTGFYNRGYGIGIGGVLLIVFVVLLVTGRL